MLKAIAKTGGSTEFLKYLLLIAFYYLAYRYPLQINSSTTSPTYVDTPVALQAFKYGLFFLISAGFLFRFFLKGTLSVPRGKFFVDFLFYLGVFTLPVFYSFLTFNSTFFQTSIFLGAVLIYFIARDRNIDVPRVRKWIDVFLGLSIVVELIQLGLFFACHRLPALGYRDSISVRFGSIWDDPNGFAFMLSFLIPFVLAKKLRLSIKLLLVAILLLMLVLTQSLTGVFAIALALILGVFMLGILLRDWTYWKQGFGLSFLYVPALIFGLTVVINLPIIREFISLKSGSIDDHIEMMGALHSATFLNYLGLDPMDIISETGYINLIYNFGILYFLLYVAMLAYVALRLIKKIRVNRGLEGSEVYYGAFFFVITFAIGMGNLPLDSVFPLNLILAICVILSYADCRRPYQNLS